MKSKNIVLIGFMGVGKGTIARALAVKLNKFTLDCDDMIESYANKKIRQIFADSGESEFRRIEKDLAKFLEKNVKNAIISTGGGFYNVKNLNDIGIVIYLRSSFDKIIERIKTSENAEKKLAKRPLLQDLDRARELHAKRDKEYKKKADFTICVEDKSVEKITDEIIKYLKNEIKKD